MYRTAVIRRAATASIVSVCRHYPKFQFDFTVRLLYQQYQQVKDQTRTRNFDSQDAASISKQASLLSGIVQCFLQLVNLSQEFKNQTIGHRKVENSDPLFEHIHKLSSIIILCIQSYNHNVVALALELLLAILQTYGNSPNVWGGFQATKEKVLGFIVELEAILFVSKDKKPYVSSQTVALKCLAEIVQYFPRYFCWHFATLPSIKTDSSLTTSLPLDRQLFAVKMQQLLEYVDHNDPLLRGSAILFVGKIICSYLLGKKVKANRKVVSLLQSSFASSKVDGEDDIIDNEAVDPSGTLLLFCLIKHVKSNNASLRKIEQHQKNKTTPSPKIRRDKSNNTSLAKSGQLLRSSTAVDNLKAKDHEKQKNKKAEQRQISTGFDINFWVQQVLAGIADSSTVTSKLSCLSLTSFLEPLFQGCGNKSYSSLSLTIIRFLSTLTSVYWLLKCEIVNLLANIDFELVAFLEYQNASVAATGNGGSLSLNVDVQEQVLGYITSLLCDDHTKVVTAASKALSTIFPRLHTLGKNLSNWKVTGIMSKKEMLSSVMNDKESIEKQCRNFMYLLPILIRGANSCNNVEAVKGYYCALMYFAKTAFRNFEHSCEFGNEDTQKASRWLSLLSIFAREVIPLALERVEKTEMDLEVHEYVLLLLAYLYIPPASLSASPASSPSTQHLLPKPSFRNLENNTALTRYCRATLTHILRLLNIIVHIIRSPTPVQYKAHTLINTDPLGFFSNIPIYVKLHEKLLSDVTSNKATLESSKFDSICLASLKALAGVLRVARNSIVAVANEIYSYLTLLLRLRIQPTWVVICCRELMLSINQTKSLTSQQLKVVNPASAANVNVQADQEFMGNKILGENSLDMRASGNILASFKSLTLLNNKNLAAAAASREQTTSMGQLRRRLFSSDSADLAANAWSCDLFDESELETLPTIPPHPLSLSNSLVSPFKADNPSPNIKPKPIVDEVLNKAPLEIFIKEAIIFYRITHNTKTQQAILSFLSETLKILGIKDRSKSDANNKAKANKRGFYYRFSDNETAEFLFYEFVKEQILGKKSYLPRPPHILPYIFYFVSTVAIQFPDLVSNEELRKLTGCVFTSPYWSTSGTLLPSVHPIIFNLYVESKKLEAVNNMKVGSRIELRQTFFHHLLQKLPLPTAISLISVLLYQFKIDGTSQLFNECASAVANMMLPILSSSAKAVATNEQEIDNQRILFHLIEDQVAPKDVWKALARLVEHANKTKQSKTMLRSPVGNTWLPGMLILLEISCKLHSNFNSAKKQFTEAMKEEKQFNINNRLTGSPISISPLSTLAKAADASPKSSPTMRAQVEPIVEFTNFILDTLKLACSVIAKKDPLVITIVSRIIRYGAYLLHVEKCTIKSGRVNIADLDEICRIVLSSGEANLSISLFQVLLVLKYHNTLWKVLALSSTSFPTTGATKDLSSVILVNNNVVSSAHQIHWSTISNAAFISYCHLLRSFSKEKQAELVASLSKDLAANVDTDADLFIPPFLVRLVENLNEKSIRETAKLLVTTPEVLKHFVTLLKTIISFSVNPEDEEKQNTKILIAWLGKRNNQLNVVTFLSLFPVNGIITQLLLQFMKLCRRQSVKTLCYAVLHTHVDFYLENSTNFTLLHTINADCADSALLLDIQAKLTSWVAPEKKLPKTLRDAMYKVIDLIEVELIAGTTTSVAGDTKQLEHSSAELIERLCSLDQEAIRTLVIRRFGVAADKSFEDDNSDDSTNINLVILLDSTMFLELLQSNLLDVAKLPVCIANPASLALRNDILKYILNVVTAALANASLQTNGFSDSQLLTKLDSLSALENCLCSLSIHHASAFDHSLHSGNVILEFCIYCLRTAFSWPVRLRSEKFESFVATSFRLSAFVVQSFYAKLFYSQNIEENDELAAVDLKEKQILEEMLQLTYLFYKRTSSRDVQQELQAFNDTENVDDDEEDNKITILDALKEMTNNLIIPEKTNNGRLRFLQSYGAESLLPFVKLVIVFIRCNVFDLVYPIIEDDEDQIYLDSHFATSSSTDKEIIEIATKLIPKLGFRSPSHFKQIFDMLLSIVEKRNAPEPLRVAALTAMTTQVVCTLESTKRIPTRKASTEGISSANKPSTSSLVFLDGKHGHKLQVLHSAIEVAVSKLHNPYTVINNSKNSSSSGIPYNKLFLFNYLESISDFKMEFLDVLQEAEMENKKQKGTKFIMTSIALDAPNPTSIASKVKVNTADYLVHLIALIELLVKSSRNLFLLRQTALKSLLSLSDYFTSSKEFMLMLRACQEANDPANIEDFASTQYAIVGICKAVIKLRELQLSMPSESKKENLTDLVSPSYISRMLRHGMESSRASLCLAALKGVILLLQARFVDMVSPFLPYLFNTITTALKAQTSTTRTLRFCTQRLQEHVLVAMFLAIQNFPKESESQKFTEQALQLALLIGSNSSTSSSIMACLFKGFNRLLISFSLSHTHRDSIGSFALQKLPTEYFLMAMGLMITCMYTADRDGGKLYKIEKDATLVHMDNVERVKTMLTKIQQGFAYEAEAVAKVLPQLLVDFFTIEQIMSLVLGEFVRTPKSGRPELIAHVLFKVTRQIPALDKIIKWVLMCLNNFIQMSPIDYRIWAISCVFLSMSNNPILQGIFYEIAFNQRVDVEVFLLSGYELYCRSELSDEDRNNFIATFEAKADSKTNSNSARAAPASFEDTNTNLHTLFDSLTQICKTKYTKKVANKAE